MQQKWGRPGAVDLNWGREVVRSEKSQIKKFIYIYVCAVLYLGPLPCINPGVATDRDPVIGTPNTVLLLCVKHIFMPIHKYVFDKFCGQREWKVSKKKIYGRFFIV